jgi:uncharacterized protein
MTNRYRTLLYLGLAAFSIDGCGRHKHEPGQLPAPQASYASYVAPIAAAPEKPLTPAEKIVARAREEVTRGVTYDAEYRTLTYPNGDVPAAKGACTDVVIRAYRAAGYDLQKHIHQDMRRNFSRYPQSYGLKRPDKSIDHRRVPNQMTFLRRFGKTLPTGTTGTAASSWRPGDIVYWKLDSGLDHCGILSDRRGSSSLPLAIHNLSVAAEEDCLTAWRITGHFRYPK